MIIKVFVKLENQFANKQRSGPPENMGTVGIRPNQFLKKRTVELLKVLFKTFSANRGVNSFIKRGTQVIGRLFSPSQKLKK